MSHKFRFLNLSILLSKFSEADVIQKMNEYECPINKEIDDFFHFKAIESVKKHQSATFIISSLKKNMIQGFYTLTHKSLEISAKGLSNTTKKRIAMHSEYDEERNCYILSAFLLAQFGKNYNPACKVYISGLEMMDYVLEHLREIREQIAGNLVYLECEEKEKLIEFYESCGFVRFGERYSKSEKIKYIQFLRFL